MKHLKLSWETPFLRRLSLGAMVCPSLLLVEKLVMQK